MDKNIPTNEATEQVLKYLSKELPELLGEKTKNGPTLAQLRSFGKEAKQLLANIETARLEANRKFEMISLQEKFDKANKSFAVTKAAQQLQVALTKGYAFIMKLRKYLTGQGVEYLLLFDDKEQQTIGKFQLKDLIPALQVTMGNDGKFRLQIKRVEELTKMKNNNEQRIDSEAEKNIISRFKTLFELRRKKQIDWELGERGVIFEAAVRTYAAGRKRIKLKDFIRDWDAFYRGGDLFGKEIPAELKKDNTSLELKRVSTSKNTVGAQLVNEGTIENVLKVIAQVTLDKDLKNAATIKQLLNHSLFKAKTNLKETVANNITKKVGKELENYIKGHFNVT